jgi:hypothetical protein
MRPRANRFVIMGDRRDRRVDLFQAALRRWRQHNAAVVDYREVISAHGRLAEAACQSCLVRIESPGRDFEIFRAMLACGADATEAEGGPALSRDAVARLAPDPGRVFFPRQWYLGFLAVLAEAERQLRGCGSVVFTSQPADIALMFDKGRCHERLRQGGVPVARPLGSVSCFDELRTRMSEARMPRVFVKLSHGSAASGVVAYETARGREQAWTTAEIVRAPDGVRLYNSRRLRRYRRHEDVSVLFNVLCSHRVHVEAWVPKASLDSRVCDLRVLSIAGEPRHSVLRLSRGPMTNLHLLNERAEASAIRARMRPNAWAELLSTCRRVASLFPRTLHVGIDIAVGPGYRSHVVLEANAFGDLLNDVTDNGLNTYEAEVAALLGLSGAALCSTATR